MTCHHDQVPVDVSAMVELARNAGLLENEESLDEAVHDVFSKKASDLNNRGQKSQISFLVREWGEEGFRRWVDDQK